MTDFIIAVSCIVENDEGDILMVQEGQEHIREKWDFPGGKMEEQETIEECSRREVLEETGYNTEFLNIIGFYFEKSQKSGKTVINIFTELEITGKGSKNLDFPEEILDEEFFSPEEIKDLELRKENRYRMLKDFKNGQEIDIENIDYSKPFM